MRFPCPSETPAPPLFEALSDSVPAVLTFFRSRKAPCAFAPAIPPGAAGDPAPDFSVLRKPKLLLWCCRIYLSGD